MTQPPGSIRTRQSAIQIKRDSDHQHDEQIDRAVDATNQHLGQGQDQRSNEN